MKDLVQMFEKIGFSDKEAQVYAMLYQRGANSVSTLAKVTGVKRTSVYDIAKELLARGLIITFQQGGTTYFAIDDVKKLYLDQKEKLNFAEKIIENLKLGGLGDNGMQVTYYKGREGYREMYEDILQYSPKELLGMMNIDNFYIGIDEEREAQWTKERHQKGIKVRLILQDSKIAREMKQVSPKINREIKIIPAKKFPFQSSSFIYENYVTFFHTHNDVFTGVRIQHPEFYRLQMEMFEMAWSFLA